MTRRRIAIVVFGLLLIAGAIAAWRYAGSVEREQEVTPEAALRAALRDLRAAIETFRVENGRPPRSLEELVPKYIPRIPPDPITGSTATWRAITEEAVEPSNDFTTRSTAATETYVVGVQSGAPPPWSEY